MILQRTHAFSLKHESNLSDEEMAKRAYFYIQKKYGVGGYAKIYFYDEEYIQFQNDLHELLNDMEQFIKRYYEVNHIMKTKNKVRSQWFQCMKVLYIDILTNRLKKVKKMLDRELLAGCMMEL